MRTKTLVLRQFEECSEELQKKILEKERYINVDYRNLTEDDEAYTLMLQEEGFMKTEISYDISCCQGSGACFDCTEFDVDKLLKDYTCKHKQWIIDIIKNECTISINNCGNWNLYVHENTRRLDIDFYDRGNCNHDRIQEMIDIINSYLENKRHDLCIDLHRDLQNDYDYLTSDECVAETLIANEYYFDEEGNIEIPND